MVPGSFLNDFLLSPCQEFLVDCDKADHLREIPCYKSFRGFHLIMGTVNMMLAVRAWGGDTVPYGMQDS